MTKAGKTPFVLGLTGSIGMGKSATARMFMAQNVPVYDADAAVHSLYQPGGAAVAPIEAIFPGVRDAEGGVDRARLREAVLGEPDRMRALEAVVHPLVQVARQAFLAHHADTPLVVLDIPLLYETSADALCDAIVVVSAPPDVQRARVLARAGMTDSAFETMLAKQLPDIEKRMRADFVIDTSQGFAAAETEVARIIAVVTMNL